MSRNVRKTEFTRHVFATLTFGRDISSSECWRLCSKRFNRWMQEYRRLHFGHKIQYLRVAEAHSDGYPHFHVIIQYPSACITVQNSRFFDPTLYQRWKSLWIYGHSDYQKPYQNGNGTIAYVLKYLAKTSTKKTIYRKIATLSSIESGLGRLSPATRLPDLEKSPASTESLFVPTHHLGVKLATWSRGFDFTPFIKKDINHAHSIALSV